MRRTAAFAAVLIVVVTAIVLGAPRIRSMAQPAPQTSWEVEFSDTFERSETLTETTQPELSSSSDWWLPSGAGLNVAKGVAATWAGDAMPGYLRSRYGLRDPVDTDGGLHPQNLFRLVTRRSWSGEVQAQSYLRIVKYHLSDSPQRFDANGLLLFSRYIDQDNLYYAGVRADGHAVVKKKSHGTYYTLAETPVFEGEYDRETSPLLLPTDLWIGLRSVTRDNPDGSVTVSLYVDRTWSGEWTLVAAGTDAGVGGAPIRAAGRAGIRTDFMDVEIDEFSVATPSRNDR